MRNLSFIVVLPIYLAIMFSCQSNSKDIVWISSNPEAIWQIDSFKSSSGLEGDSAIIIYPDKLQQQIDGFGGCFNELGWEALKVLPEEEQDKIIAALFDSVSGCKFNICRMPIGANDYAVDWYSHNETKGDFAMENFSILRDNERLIPYIKAAQKYKPDLKIWASPWCPPSWMKTNNHYACRPDSVNDLTKDGEGAEMVSQFRLEKEYLAAYALYFSKFVQAYNRDGITIYAVHVQNEPNSCQNFPSCIWTPSGLAEFIGNYLGPQFENDSLSTEIWLGTIERPQIERIDTVLQNSKAGKYIKGVGFQWAGKDAIPLVKLKYPEYKLMQTETECGFGTNDWPAAEYTFGLMKHYFNNDANAYMYWNMILDETGKSNWGWKQNSMITIDSQTKAVSYNPEFYLMKHFSAFVVPGAYKVESSDKNCLAFKNPGSIVFVYFNEGADKEKLFVIGDVSYRLKLKAKSLNTFSIKL